MKRLVLSGLVAFSIWQSLAYADDTDIYVNVASNPAAPHLMLMFDYDEDLGRNYCTKTSGASSCEDRLTSNPELLTALKEIVGVDADGNIIRDASTIDAVMAVFQVVFAKFEDIYVGLMIPNETNGGTILRGFEEFQANDANGAKEELIDILMSIPVTGVKGESFHTVASKETHYELWRYLNGGAVEYGTSTADNFKGTHTPDYDSSIISGGNYISPFSTVGVDYSCTKLYEVYATSGKVGGVADESLDTEIGNDMDDSAKTDFNSMVRYLANNDLVDDSLATGEQTLKMWFIQMGTAAAQADDWAEQAGTIDQYMQVGGNNVDLADVQATLEAAFIEALSVSTTFVSASVPVNVFNRIQTLDNFYIALFEASTTERWPGNIKKMRLADTDVTPDGEYDDIVDVNGTSAFSDEDGRIKFEALTYWTDTDELPAADTDKGEIDGRDGRSVARGGAGQKIPGFISDNVGTTTTTGTRQLYVEPATAPSNGVAVNFDVFNADATTIGNLQSLLGASTTTEAEELISWARGIDVDDADNDSSTTDTRPWILGDAIHSRPLALNYGATTGYDASNPNIRLFMGTNDGFFHIFENKTSAGDESGEEVFAFIPRESLDIIKKIRTNDGSSNSDGTSNKHPYGVDGEPVALVVDDDRDGTIESGEEVYVYVGMRRGGKSYYALDVSDPSALPTFKWKITKTVNGDFDELGYTFSTPRVAKVQYEDDTHDVLIFTGGYDTNKDANGQNADTEGNAIYIVDARTGALIWKAVDGSGTDTDTIFYHGELDHSIPSAVATLDSNSNGVVDRAYVGDSSGVVWRIDLPEGTAANHRRDNWQITKFADLGGTGANDRRFFHPPDIVQTRDSDGKYDGIVIESGDRASPLETEDQNYLYLLKDRETTSGNPGSAIDVGNLVDTTACVTGSESGCDLLDYEVGWKIELQEDGEKGLSSPITADGKIFATSYRPATGANSCAPQEGSGALFVVNLKDGTAVFDTRDIDIGPGIPPQVTAIGDDTLIIPGSGIADPFDPNGSSDKSKLFQTGGKSMYIIYWRQPGVDSL